MIFPPKTVRTPTLLEVTSMLLILRRVSTQTLSLLSNGDVRSVTTVKNAVLRPASLAMQELTVIRLLLMV